MANPLKKGEMWIFKRKQAETCRIYQTGVRHTMILKEGLVKEHKVISLRYKRKFLGKKFTQSVGKFSAKSN